jgi:folate-binding protein YgfZ
MATEFRWVSMESRRRWLVMEGPDVLRFLDGQLTQQIAWTGTPLMVYGLALTPQGKLRADAMVVMMGPELVWLALPWAVSDALRAGWERVRLRMRWEARWQEGAAVGVMLGARDVAPVSDSPVSDSGWRWFADPRSASLGWWGFREVGASLLEPSWEEVSLDCYDVLRIRHLIAEGHADIGERDFPLWFDLDRVGAIHGNKGCYVGQEVTARMMHRGSRRRRLVQLEGDGLAFGREIAGTGVTGGVLTTVGDRALAWLRLEEEGGGLPSVVSDVMRPSLSFRVISVAQA